MTEQELVNWCVANATAHPIEALAIVVVGFVCASQLVGALMLIPGAIEESRKKREASRSAAIATDATPTDKAKKDGPWTR